MAERLVDKHIEEIRRLHPEVFGPAGGAEEGEVLPRESAPKKPSKPRPADLVTGKEIVEQSSKRPIVVKPSLEASPMELAKHRADTHIRIAHNTSNFIAHVTGFMDGVFDATANGIGEFIEDGVFLVSKTVHGVKHGWSRGIFPGDRNQ